MTAPTRVPLRDAVADTIRDGGYLKRIKVRTVHIGDGIYRVTVTPGEGQAFTEWARLVLAQIIVPAFQVGTVPARISVLQADRIVFRWYR